MIEEGHFFRAEETNPHTIEGKVIVREGKRIINRLVSPDNKLTLDALFQTLLSSNQGLKIARSTIEKGQVKDIEKLRTKLSQYLDDFSPALDQIAQSQIDIAAEHSIVITKKERVLTLKNELSQLHETLAFFQTQPFAQAEPFKQKLLLTIEKISSIINSNTVDKAASL